MTWNDDFGDWQGLASPRQAPRYERIANLICHFAPEASVLDVGCGEGLLRSFLPPSVHYYGIEPSQKAIEGHPGITRNTAEAFDTAGQRWNCIIFNEMLYYARDPIFLLRKYSESLYPGGAFIISIFQRRGKPTLSARLRHWSDRRRPISNIHCTEMVLDFIRQSGWSIEHDSLIQEHWRIWMTRPHQTVTAVLS